MDQSVAAASLYWKGEAQYRLKDYDGAIHSYNDFLFTPAALKFDYYNLANYNIGYSYFKEEKYSDAESAFRKYIADNSKTDKARYNDALLRIADAFFMLKDQANALDYYSRAIENKAQSSDYALYQKAVILGIQNKSIEKISTLEKIFSGYPKSVYYDDALYEAANASMLNGNNDQALARYKKLINDFPNSSYVKKAMLGLVAWSITTASRMRMPLKHIKDVVEKYPNTAESREALAQLKNIAIGGNKVDDYLAYIKNVPNADVSLAAQDSLLYEAAELRYTRGNYAMTQSEEMDSYLSKFPEGGFRINANYYKADCQYQQQAI